MAAAFFVFPLTARADILIEPNNDFYSRNSGKCVYLGRNFYANGKDGYISLKNEPGSKKEAGTIENGNIVNIMFTYANDKMWGVTEIYSDFMPNIGWGANGWVLMDDLLLVYDYISFKEDYGHEFYPYEGGYGALYDAPAIALWSWPGSGVSTEKIDAVLRGAVSEFHWPAAAYAYKDGEGREWCFFNYLYARRNFWVCVSDPGNEDIEAFNPPPKPELWEAKPGHTAGETRSDTPPMPVLAVILVAGVIAVTAVLIRIIYRKR